MGSRSFGLIARGLVMKRKVLALQQLASNKGQEADQYRSHLSLLLCHIDD